MVYLFIFLRGREGRGTLRLSKYPLSNFSFLHMSACYSWFFIAFLSQCFFSLLFDKDKLRNRPTDEKNTKSELARLSGAQAE